MLMVVMCPSQPEDKVISNYNLIPLFHTKLPMICTTIYRESSGVIFEIM